MMFINFKKEYVVVFIYKLVVELVMYNEENY